MHILLKDLLLESIGNTADKYFSEEAMNRAIGTASGNSRSIVIHMDPKDFLIVAQHMPKSNKQSYEAHADGLKDLILKGTKLDSVPQLSFTHDGKGIAKTVDHDGRHRALMFARLGIKSMPVLLKSMASRSGDSIRWNSQSDPKSFDYFKQVWPTVLQGETSGEIPFPASDPRS